MAWENVKKLKLSLSQKWISLLNVLKFNIPFRWGVVPENFLQGLSSFREHCPDSDKTGKQQAGYCVCFHALLTRVQLVQALQFLDQMRIIHLGDV